MTKYVYMFNEGNKDMKELLGGKGANLAEMTKLGLPVPSGFTVSTEACLKYYDNNQELPQEIIDEILDKYKSLESITGKRIGDDVNPLLVSVRSGARASMPGMMDTILNLGLNDEVAKSFALNINNERFVYDNYRRLIQMYADVVKGFPKSSFEKKFDEIKEQKGVKLDTELSSLDLKEIVNIYKDEYLRLAGEEFPQDANVQLIEAVKAVFRSWNNERAVTYRNLNNIPSNWGTAVNIQEMVYGNMGETSGTGVAFTRNPATGENKLYGEYLMNAQGEDVVAGIRTPQSIETLKEVSPKCYQEFLDISKTLENHYRDMQDMEFTIENDKLYILQTRSGKRTAEAALQIVVDLVNEGMISKEEALLRIEPKQLDSLLHPTFDEESLKNATPIAKGLAASPGAACGKIYFTASDINMAYQSGEKDLILVRLETSPEDIEGMNLAHGVLTVRGGMTSHAAVVARGMGTCCVSGCSEIIVNEVEKTLTTKDGKVFHEGDYLSLNGSDGLVYGEKINTKDAVISGNFETFMSWADEVRSLGIRVNADTPKDAVYARSLGAEGIGLCRTEHMFFDSVRLFNFRRMITANSLEKREEALMNILPYQREDFEGLFRAMDGYSVNVRLLDPPLHEFLPHTDEDIRELAESLSMDFDSLKDRVDSIREFNPMMGHRGCRLDVTYPEIAVMQTRAIIEALINVTKEGIKSEVEIMIPLVGDVNEMKYVKNIIVKTAEEIIKTSGVDVKYLVGCMIEVPRAIVIADKLAMESSFFSFGTNDLTQLSYGFSRDDAGKFLKDYYSKGIFVNDPFAKIDQEGIGTFMKMGVELGRRVNPNLKIGICGEHAGETSSIEFCNSIGLNYVSCSPYRIPLARLAAAQASIREKANK